MKSKETQVKQKFYLTVTPLRDHVRLRDLPAKLNAFLLSEAIRGVISPQKISKLRRTLGQEKLYRKSGGLVRSFYLSVVNIGEITKEPRAVVHCVQI